MAILRYPGGKWNIRRQLTPWLKELILGETDYCEPFIGGGAVAYQTVVACGTPGQDRLRHIWLNDADPGIAALWATVVGGWTTLVNLIDRLPQRPTIAEYRQVAQSEPTSDLERAYQRLYLNRCNFGGLHKATPMGGLSQTGRYKIDHCWNKDEMYYCFHHFHLMLHNVSVVTCLDFHDFLFKHSERALFLDPPYRAVNGVARMYGAAMSARDHRDLAAILKGCRKWVMTLDNCPEVRKLYSWANITPLRVRYQSRRTKRQTELVISSF